MEGTPGAAVGMCECVRGAQRSDLIQAVRKGLPEDAALEMRAEGPAGPHGVRLGWGRHALRGNRMYKCRKPVQVGPREGDWDETRLCHAGS